MKLSSPPVPPLSIQNTLHPVAARRLQWAEAAALVLGVGAGVIHRGLLNLTQIVQWELGLTVFFALLLMTVSLSLRYQWSRTRSSFRKQQRAKIFMTLLWSVGTFGILLFGPLVADWNGLSIDRPVAILLWSELCVFARGVIGAILLTRHTTAISGTNPALMFVGSFVILIATGTVLLMLPKAYADPLTLETGFLDRLRVAAFTSTSASCVTGLVLVDTGGPNAYWSRMGQTVIMGLIQFGGLGIMTCGAFFAVISGKAMQLRESATLHEVLEAEDLGDVRRLVLGIFGFTLVTELVGAVLLSGLWADLPLGERIYYSAFHSVSAFCNAGFSLRPESFLGWGTRWQVWAVVPSLIIIGGLGFTVLYNVAFIAQSRVRAIQMKPLFNLSPLHARLSISSRIVLTTTAILLVVGAVAYDALETVGQISAERTPASRIDVGEDPTPPDRSAGSRAADAWFQSVTFRTAGFNTVDHAKLQPATKLLAIFLMFIGAAPGSTGGGIKVVVFALAVLRLTSLLNGRQRIEIGKRIIPDVIVNRALTVIALGGLVVMATTMLLVIFEHNEALFLDHLYEATSAFATVGVSSVNTATLTAPSQCVLIVTMFLGRVGPLTILIGLAGQSRPATYEYPTERVTLG